MVRSTHHGSPAGWPLRMALQSEKICGQLFSWRKLFLLTDRPRNWALIKRFHLVPARKGTVWASHVLIQHTEEKCLEFIHWSSLRGSLGIHPGTRGSLSPVSAHVQSEGQKWFRWHIRATVDFTKPSSLQRLRIDLYQKVGRHLQQTPGLIGFLFFGHIPKFLDIE